MYLTFHISGNLFTLRKKGHVCENPNFEQDLGIFGTVTECALACKDHATCKYFSYRRWEGIGQLPASGKCYWERTIAADCPGGFVENDKYDFYALSGNI